MRCRVISSVSTAYQLIEDPPASSRARPSCDCRRVRAEATLAVHGGRVALRLSPRADCEPQSFERPDAHRRLSSAEAR